MTWQDELTPRETAELDRLRAKMAKCDEVRAECLRLVDRLRNRAKGRIWRARKKAERDG